MNSILRLCETESETLWHQTLTSRVQCSVVPITRRGLSSIVNMAQENVKVNVKINVNEMKHRIEKATGGQKDRGQRASTFLLSRLSGRAPGRSGFYT